MHTHTHSCSTIITEEKQAMNLGGQRADMVEQREEGNIINTVVIHEILKKLVKIL